MAGTLSFTAGCFTSKALWCSSGTLRRVRGAFALPTRAGSVLSSTCAFGSDSKPPTDVRPHTYSLSSIQHLADCRHSWSALSPQMSHCHKWDHGLMRWA